MIVSFEKVTKTIINFLKTYLKEHGKDGWVIDNNPANYLSYLCYNICERTGFPAYINESGGKHSVIAAQELADEKNSLVVSWYPKEWFDFRLYRKGFIGDIFPFGDLFNSELEELFIYTFPEEKILPLPEYDFSYEDYEWASNEEKYYKVICSDQDPTKNKHWGRYTVSQRRIIAKLNQREKLTRHKSLESPNLCQLRIYPSIIRR